jgi:hypothetical protein
VGERSHKLRVVRCKEAPLASEGQEGYYESLQSAKAGRATPVLWSGEQSSSPSSVVASGRGESCISSAGVRGL